MKDYRIIYLKGEPLVVGWPEKRNPIYFTRFQNIAIQEFEEAKKLAIANGVPPADKEQAENIAWLSSVGNGNTDYAKRVLTKPIGFTIKEGHPYSLEGYNVRIGNILNNGAKHDGHQCEYTVCQSKCLGWCKKVAIITTKEKV